MPEEAADHKKQIEKILGEMKCRKGISGYKLGLKDICKAKDIGLDKFLECHEKDPYRCEFSLSFGDSYFCKCPLGLYIAKKLRK